MGYFQNSPNGVLYLGNVKWSNDNTHVMLFASKNARNSFMISNLSLVKSNVIYNSPNTYIDIESKVANAESINYAFFKNDSDISSSYYCCFVTNFEYIAPEVTRLYVQLDVFQMYIYDCNLYQSYIDRAIIPKSADIVGANTLPEPVGAKVEHFNVVKDFLSADDFSPRWVLHMASRYNPTTKEYEYIGNGSNNTFGEYGAYISSAQQIKDLLAFYGRKSIDELFEEITPSFDWKALLAAFLSGGTSTYTYDQLQATRETFSIADIQDHRNELIGLYAIPKWVIDNYGGDTSNLDNRNVETSISFTINKTTIADGTADEYTPRNKKLLTSICRAYCLANRNGVKIPFKPELFKTTALTFTLRAIAMATNGYQYYTDNYEDVTVGNGEIVYSSERRVGYDQNTGLNKTVNMISAGSQIVGGVANVAANIGAQNYVGAAMGAAGLAGSAISAIDQIGNREEHFGSNGDLLRTRGRFSQLHFYELYPKKDQMQAIDNFFDMYGYSIKKHLNPANYMRNRSMWNYVKTENVNLSVNAPADYENEIKAAFNSGVTFWHDYSHFGDYSQSNN